MPHAGPACLEKTGSLAQDVTNSDGRRFGGDGRADAGGCVVRQSQVAPAGGKAEAGEWLDGHTYQGHGQGRGRHLRGQAGLAQSGARNGAQVCVTREGATPDGTASETTRGATTGGSTTKSQTSKSARGHKIAKSERSDNTKSARGHKIAKSERSDNTKSERGHKIAKSTRSKNTESTRGHKIAKSTTPNCEKRKRKG